jgi:signal transduction histidine kinase/CheY-like chemotaxis protein
MEKLSAALGGAPQLFEWVHKRADGTLFDAEVSLSSIENREGHAVQAILRDISARKRTDLEIQRSKKLAEEADSLKSTLLSNLSHEFTTPIAGILGNADLLMNELAGSPVADLAEGIMISGKRLHLTLDSILELAHLSARTSPYGGIEFRVGDEVSRTMEEFDLLARMKGLALRVDVMDDNCVVKADKRSFQIVCSNLIDNAIKFTNKGGVRVQVRRERGSEGEVAVCEVFDTGVGISADHLETIYKEFTQLSQGMNRSHEGMGIGLTVAKRISDFLHWSLAVQSEVGTGSVFSFRVPIAKAAEKLESQTSSRRFGLRKLSVLLVEDNLINAEVMKRELQKEYRVELAQNGEQAISLAHRSLYDIILMDIHLGKGLSGVEVTKYLRTLRKYDKVPIAAVTGYALSDDRSTLMAAGFTHFQAKPFLTEDIARLVNEMAQYRDGSDGLPS